MTQLAYPKGLHITHRLDAVEVHLPVSSSGNWYGWKSIVAVVGFPFVALTMSIWTGSGQLGLLLAGALSVGLLAWDVARSRKREAVVTLGTHQLVLEGQSVPYGSIEQLEFVFNGPDEAALRLTRSGGETLQLSLGDGGMLVPATHRAWLLHQATYRKAAAGREHEVPASLAPLRHEG